MDPSRAHGRPGVRAFVPPTASMAEGGFTLVELLVTMAVVALLTALLLPLMTTVKEAARSARCLGQVRQFVIGSLAYAEDHRGFLPANYAPGAGTNRWSDRIAPYLVEDKNVNHVVDGQTRQKGIFRCPSINSLPLREDQLEAWMIANYTVFRMASSNYVMVENLDSVDFNPRLGPDYFSSTWTTDWRKYKIYRVSGVTHPSNRMLYCDSTVNEEFAMYQSAKVKIETLAAQSRKGGPPVLADYQGWIKGAGHTAPGFAGFWVETRHRNKAAAGFIDGRAGMVYAAQGVVAAYAPDRLAEFYP